MISLREDRHPRRFLFGAGRPQSWRKHHVQNPTIGPVRAISKGKSNDIFTYSRLSSYFSCSSARRPPLNMLKTCGYTDCPTPPFVIHLNALKPTLHETPTLSKTALAGLALVHRLRPFGCLRLGRLAVGMFTLHAPEQHHLQQCRHPGIHHLPHCQT